MKLNDCYVFAIRRWEMGIWQCLLSTDRLPYAKYGKVLKEFLLLIFLKI